MKVVLQNLTKQFPSRNKKSNDVVTAVSDFNFEIPDGKLIGLLGPSGCGKSTALNLISGLIAPTRGRIFFGDDDVTDLPPENRGVGLVFQSYALYPHLTVRENIMFPLENLKGAERPSKAEMERRVLEAAKLVQIDGLLDRKPGEMSGGQQQRVAIARAVVKMPKVLLLDEPLSNLDARLRLQTREEIRRIQRDTGITTVFVTHDQEEAMSISDMIVVMKDGVVQQIGKPQAVYDDPVNLFVSKFLGTPPINVFEGRVKGGRLIIGNEDVLAVPGAPDGEVWNWASKNFRQVLIIPGNHEFYGYGDVAKRGDSWQYMFRKNIGYYSNKVVRIDDVDFILTTLWSMIPPEDEYFVWRGLNDFRQIMCNGRRLTIDDYNSEHQKCLSFLKCAVEESTAKQIVVVSHHLPTKAVVAPQHQDSLLNSAFATELGSYIADSRINVWIYGHSHTNINTTIRNTRIVSNQLGYVGYQEHLHNGFNPQAYIELKQQEDE